MLPNASKMMRAGQRIDTSFSPYYYSLAKSGWERQSSKGVALGSPIWGSLCRMVGPTLKVGFADLQVHALGKYSDAAGNMDWCGPQNQAYGGKKKFWGPSSCLPVQDVTSDLVNCSPVQDVLTQGLFNKKITTRGGGWLVWWLMICLGWWQDSCSAELTTGCHLVLKSRFS